MTKNNLKVVKTDNKKDQELKEKNKSLESARVQINFEKAGSKWLVLAFAKLEMLG